MGVNSKRKNLELPCTKPSTRQAIFNTDLRSLSGTFKAIDSLTCTMAAYAALTNYLPGTASLIEEIDKKLLVVLRDGRTLIGWLRSIDQFANLVLHR